MKQRTQGILLTSQQLGVNQQQRCQGIHPDREMRWSGWVEVAAECTGYGKLGHQNQGQDEMQQVRVPQGFLQGPGRVGTQAQEPAVVGEGPGVELTGVERS